MFVAGSSGALSRSFAVLLLVSVLAGLPSPSVRAEKAAAYRWSSNDLRRLCSSPDQSELNLCWGFVRGAAEVLQVGANATVCLSTEDTTPEVAEAVVAQIDARPDLWHRSAAVLTIWALTTLYPCPLG